MEYGKIVVPMQSIIISKKRGKLIEETKKTSQSLDEAPVAAACKTLPHPHSREHYVTF